MSPLVSIWVFGIPRPKGSMTPFLKPDGKCGMHEKRGHSGQWRRTVAKTARKAIDGRPGFPYTGPVEVAAALTFVRPQNPRSPLPDTQSTGDADKHARNILDALQDAGVLRNDGQVVNLAVSMRFDVIAGAHIDVTPVWAQQLTIGAG